MAVRWFARFRNHQDREIILSFCMITWRFGVLVGVKA
jgi:hypothetical protein